MGIEKAPPCPTCRTPTMRWKKPDMALWLCSTATCPTFRVRRDAATLQVTVVPEA